MNTYNKYIPFLRKIAPFLLIAAIFGLAFFYAHDLLARPGGGHGHSGGGGRSSGGGHSSGGGGGGSGGGQAIAYFLMYALPAFPAAFGIFLFPV